MQQRIVSDVEGQARTSARTHLFMAATLDVAGVATPVKIRDLSPEGAQIESALIPGVGSAMTLTRGALSVTGHVTWVRELRCGLLFTARVSVQEWMANSLNREQRRVDHVVAAVKAGAVPLAPVTCDRVTEPACPAEDLRQVSRLLEMLGEALVGDPAIVTVHGVVLQNLDIAGQTLVTLADRMRGGEPASAASVTRLRELRASCVQALRAKT